MKASAPLTVIAAILLSACETGNEDFTFLADVDTKGAIAEVQNAINSWPETTADQFRQPFTGGFSASWELGGGTSVASLRRATALSMFLDMTSATPNATQSTGPDGARVFQFTGPSRNVSVELTLTGLTALVSGNADLNYFRVDQRFPAEATAQITSLALVHN